MHLLPFTPFPSNPSEIFFEIMNFQSLRTLLRTTTLTFVCALPSIGSAQLYTLFNGKDLSNWYGRDTISAENYAAASEEQKAKWNADIAKHWRIEGDEIVNDGHGAFLTTSQEFGDFDFTFDYKIVRTVIPESICEAFLKFKFGSRFARHQTARWSKGERWLWNNPAGWSGKIRSCELTNRSANGTT